MEERDGERRNVFIGISPLLGPLPTPTSRGEEESARVLQEPPVNLDSTVEQRGRKDAKPERKGFGRQPFTLRVSSADSSKRFGFAPLRLGCSVQLLEMHR